LLLGWHLELRFAAYILCSPAELHQLVCYKWSGTSETNSAINATVYKRDNFLSTMAIPSYLLRQFCTSHFNLLLEGDCVESLFDTTRQ